VKIKKLFKLFLLSIVIIFILEVMLRFQQMIGPVVDLEFKEISLDVLSDQINHKNIGRTTWIQPENKKIIEKFFDQNGIRIDSTAPDYSKYSNTFKILCLGDSFMEGFEDEHTIPYYIRKYLQKTHLKDVLIHFLNAGCASYSPAIFIPQAKILIPLLKPDFILIDIDETDLCDDFIRYKDLIARDNTGKNIAVRHTPINYLWCSGFLQIKKQPLYITRLFSRIYHSRIYMPMMIKKYRKKDNRNPLSLSRDKDGSYKKYASEISFFENNLTELVETLIDLMGEKRRILFIYHPHLQHIKPDAEGFYWNTFVSDTIKKVCKKYQIAFYNATDDLRVSFKNEPEKYYFFPKDMHFNYAGFKIYSDFVASKLMLMIEPLIKQANKE
jgi:hypothetical protein